jgi:hypothetical protein
MKEVKEVEGEEEGEAEVEAFFECLDTMELEELVPG